MKVVQNRDIEFESSSLLGEISSQVTINLEEISLKSLNFYGFSNRLQSFV